MDNNHYIVGKLPSGEVVIHGAPGAEPVDPVHIYKDGSQPWTWNEIAADHAELTACCTPHEWFGEDTAENLDTSLWPRIN